MDVIDAIRNRRSIGKVKEEKPPAQAIEQILEAARWAPNHHKTEPWHFYILSGEGRDKLGEVYGKINLEKLTDPSSEQQEQAWQSGLKKARRAPVVIVNVVEPAEGEKIEKVEEIAAFSCAVQNLLLTAHALGLAAKWRTGKANFHEEMRKAFGVSEGGLVLGMIYVGYAAEEGEVTPKKEVSDYTTWIS